MKKHRTQQGLLCVANFPANTGYAWDFIEGLFADIADMMSEVNVSTWVAYPVLGEPPRALERSTARSVELSFAITSVKELMALVKFLRQHRIRTVYLNDRPIIHPLYLLLKVCGVKLVIDHIHTAGGNTRPSWAKKWVKKLCQALPGMSADKVIAVSDFVAQRKETIDLVPHHRILRIWNSLAIPAIDSKAPERLRTQYGISSKCPIIVCACRATREKGVGHLLRAFNVVVAELDRQGAPLPVMFYVGDGPFFASLTTLRECLRFSERIIFTGYQADVRCFIAGADLCVVPSVLEEAFCLSVLEPMLHGIPVIASRVGAIPEVIEEGETGMLFCAGDELEMSRALEKMLSDARLRRRMGENGRRRACNLFSRDHALSDLMEVLTTRFLLDRDEHGTPVRLPREDVSY